MPTPGGGLGFHVELAGHQPLAQLVVTGGYLGGFREFFLNIAFSPSKIACTEASWRSIA